MSQATKINTGESRVSETRAGDTNTNIDTDTDTDAKASADEAYAKVNTSDANANIGKTYADAPYFVGTACFTRSCSSERLASLKRSSVPTR